MSHTIDGYSSCTITFPFTWLSISKCPSRWPHVRRSVMSSIALTLGSWVRIPLGVWAYVRDFSVSEKSKLVFVLNELSIMPWRHMGEWRYSSTIVDLDTSPQFFCILVILYRYGPCHEPISIPRSSTQWINSELEQARGPNHYLYLLVSYFQCKFLFVYLHSDSPS
jgi:hypothetical protein